MSTKQPRADGFKDIQELRLIIFSMTSLRDAAALGLHLPPPPTHSPKRRDGAAQGAP